MELSYNNTIVGFIDHIKTINTKKAAFRDKGFKYQNMKLLYAF